MRKFTKGVAAITMLLTVVGCNKKQETIASYSYHDAIGATPAEWNPHILTSANNSFIHSMTTMGWVSIGMDANKNYEWKYEMADSITDITASFDQKAKYGIGEEEANRVYEIKLNKAARWENGAAINADSYLYSLQQLLDADMKNARSVQYTDNVAAIKNAKEYMYRGRTFYGFLQGNETLLEKDGYYYTSDDHPLYFSVDESIPVLGGSLRAYYEFMPEAFMDGETNLFTQLDIEKNDDGYVALSSSLQAAMKKVAKNLGNEGFWIYLCLYQAEYNAAWEDVGFLKKDDYTLIYITKSPAKREDLYPIFSSNFLVYEPLYEQGKTTVGELKATNYATSVETYLSFGPYKLASFERNKQIVLEKNDAWYGYSDNKHQGEFQTTKIYGEVLSAHETILSNFLKGDLEMVSLNNNDMKTYRYSDHLLKADESFVFSICMNSNLDQLIALESQAEDGSNKRVGAYKKFKEALSYAINRLNFVTEGTAGSKVQYGLFNTQYYYDADNDPSSIYRLSDYGMKAIVSHYGIAYGEGQTYATLQQAYESITGYDINKARTLFQEVYLQMKNEGNYTDGQNIRLDCLCTEQSSINEEKLQQQNLLNKYIEDATKGTGFEGRIAVNFTKSSDNYKDFHDGKAEMILHQKSGMELSPYTQICKYIVDGDYTVPESACFDPRNEYLTLEINGAAITKTSRQWAKAINVEGDYYKADNDTKLLILSSLEQYLLDQYIDIPVYSRCQVSLNSKKINQGSNEYNLFYGFGGIRYVTYNYTDAAWKDYVKQNGGTLNYV